MRAVPRCQRTQEAQRRLVENLLQNFSKTGSIDVAKDCQSYFATDLPSCDLKRKQDKFILRYMSTVNGFCQFCNKL